jgi:hypothetical protein
MALSQSPSKALRMGQVLAPQIAIGKPGCEPPCIKPSGENLCPGFPSQKDPGVFQGGSPDLLKASEFCMAPGTGRGGGKEIRPYFCTSQPVCPAYTVQLWWYYPLLVREQKGRGVCVWGGKGCQVTWLSDGANSGPKPGLSSNSQGWGPEGEVGCCGVLKEGKVGRAR